MKAGIAVESWKLAIFEKQLKESGYLYEVKPGIVPDTNLIQVEAEDRSDKLLLLEGLCKKANAEARCKRMN